MRQQATIAALSLSLVGISVLGGRAQTRAAPDPTAFHLLEATIDDIHEAFQAKQLTCRALIELYLRRIDAYDKAGPSRPLCWSQRVRDSRNEPHSGPIDVEGRV